MPELVVLVQTFGPVLGLVIFMLWSQLKSVTTQPKIETIESRVETLETIADRMETIEDLMRGLGPRLDLLTLQLKTNRCGVVDVQQATKQDDKGCNLPA
jgi:hypothetical protein